MATPLADLAPTVRRARITDAVDAALRQITEPVATAELVKRASVILGAEKETNLIARVVVDLARDHASARETGETFVKYGKVMKRREWLPATRKRKPAATQISLDADELQRRREVIAAHEAEDEWTVQPTTYLED